MHKKQTDREWMFFLAALHFLFTSSSWAACSSPTGALGQFQYISPEYKYCNNMDWRSMTVSITATSCTKEGELNSDGTNMRFCNGSFWVIADGGVSGDSCTGTTIGTIQWRSSTGRLEWCNGTDWKFFGTDPCSGRTIGQACSGTTALYAGQYESGRYMIMPSGCADSTSNPSCSGADTITKRLRENGATDYDIPGLTNVALASSPSSYLELGNYTTPIIAAITLTAQGGVHPAANHCANMVYGGYSDWYLPSKSELSYIYCKSSPSWPDPPSPPEDTGCAIHGGISNQLTGFVEDWYASSTERNSAEMWVQNFTTGAQFAAYKGNLPYVRCIRRY